MRKISRSSRDAFNTCQRRGYWNFEYAGTGLDTPFPDQALLIGLGLHKGLETFFKGGSVDEALEAGEKEYQEPLEPLLATTEDPRYVEECQENSLLVQALIYAWLTRRATAFLERYEILQVEKELRTPLASNVLLMSRLDLLVRDRLTNLLWVMNWKSSKSNDLLNLQEKFSHDPQMWAEALAAEWDLGEPVEGTLLEVFFKGVRRSGTYSNHLLYGYQKGAEVKPSYTKGWTKVRADQMPGGLKGWIDSLPEESISKHLITLDPVMKDNEVVEDRLSVWVHKEQEIEHVLASGTEEDKLLHFAPREGPWCVWCPFKDPCFKRISIEEMLSSGRLTPRKDHHNMEGQGIVE